MVCFIELDRFYNRLKAYMNHFSLRFPQYEDRLDFEEIEAMKDYLINTVWNVVHKDYQLEWDQWEDVKHIEKFFYDYKDDSGYWALNSKGDREFVIDDLGAQAFYDEVIDPMESIISQWARERRLIKRYSVYEFDRKGGLWTMSVFGDQRAALYCKERGIEYVPEIS